MDECKPLFRGQLDEARVWSAAVASDRAALRGNTAAGTEAGTYTRPLFS